ncbi:MAG: hypothetical protein JNK89_01160, partial [Saprospiraceae bacterium]|nr:hypothetical protein [Saprospiraceae bacterium]
CINTTTAGRRTLSDFEGGPLPWTEDLDGDGQSELILWESVDITNDPDLSGMLSGLAAWVYCANKEGVLRLDWALSRNFAKRIAAAYRKPDNNSPFEHYRKLMAENLEAFAQGKCQAQE